MHVDVTPRERPAWWQHLLVVAAACLVTALVVRRAWLCDDAYITLRTVDNWVCGFGLRWNVAERVQSYTHPLWMLLLSSAYVFTREPYFTTLGVSVTVSACSIALFAWGAAARGWQVAVAGLLAMAASKAFVDFSTGGLENPLSHLLVLALALVAARPLPSARDATVACTLGALAVCNRLDLAVLIGPLLYACLRPLGWRHATRAALVGALPLVAWLIFSIVYYGFPLPNTAYTKLGSGIPSRARLVQGLAYLLESLLSDPATLVAIGVGTCLAVCGGQGRLRAGAVSLAASVAYIVWVGGDFMSGRFLTPAFVLALAVVALAWTSLQVAARRALLVAAIALLAVRASDGLVRQVVLGSDPLYRGVVDERTAYVAVTGLWSSYPGRAADHAWAEEGRSARAGGEGLVLRAPIGFFGYYAGPGVHVLDVHGLADPLIARLPSSPLSRAGHPIHPMPEGYPESLASGANRLKDRKLVAFYDDLRLVTRSPLWTVERWAAIARLNVRRPPRPTTVIE